MKRLSILGITLMFMACNNQQKEVTGSPAASGPATESTDTKPVTDPNVVPLPEAANKFIADHFAGTAIVNTDQKMSPSADGTFFETRLADGTELDFDKEGNWKEISVKDQKNVPVSAIPEPIRTHLSANYPNIAVQVIDKESTGYELELANDVDLYFDLDGKFQREEK